MNKQALLFYPLLGVVLLVLFVGGLAYGAVPIPLDHVMDILLGKGSDKIAWQNIVLQSRLPQAITALLAGASLATSGLLLQTLFRNPLAGPSILGISDGANPTDKKAALVCSWRKGIQKSGVMLYFLATY